MATKEELLNQINTKIEEQINYENNEAHIQNLINSNTYSSRDEAIAAIRGTRLQYERYRDALLRDELNTEGLTFQQIRDDANAQGGLLAQRTYEAQVKAEERPKVIASQTTGEAPSLAEYISSYEEQLQMSLSDQARKSLEQEYYKTYAMTPSPYGITKAPQQDLQRQLYTPIPESDYLRAMQKREQEIIDSTLRSNISTGSQTSQFLAPSFDIESQLPSYTIGGETYKVPFDPIGVIARKYDLKPIKELKFLDSPDISSIYRYKSFSGDTTQKALAGGALFGIGAYSEAKRAIQDPTSYAVGFAEFPIKFVTKPTETITELGLYAGARPFEFAGQLATQAAILKVTGGIGKSVLRKTTGYTPEIYFYERNIKKSLTEYPELKVRFEALATLQKKFRYTQPKVDIFSVETKPLSKSPVQLKDIFAKEIYELTSKRRGEVFGSQTYPGLKGGDIDIGAAPYTPTSNIFLEAKAFDILSRARGLKAPRLTGPNKLGVSKGKLTYGKPIVEEGKIYPGEKVLEAHPAKPIYEDIIPSILKENQKMRIEDYPYYESPVKDVLGQRQMRLRESLMRETSRMVDLGKEKHPGRIKEYVIKPLLEEYKKSIKTAPPIVKQFKEFNLKDINRLIKEFETGKKQGLPSPTQQSLNKITTYIEPVKEPKLNVKELRIKESKPTIKDYETFNPYKKDIYPSVQRVSRLTKDIYPSTTKLKSTYKPVYKSTTPSVYNIPSTTYPSSSYAPSLKPTTYKPITPYKEPTVYKAPDVYKQPTPYTPTKIPTYPKYPPYETYTSLTPPPTIYTPQKPPKFPTPRRFESPIPDQDPFRGRIYKPKIPKFTERGLIPSLSAVEYDVRGPLPFKRYAGLELRPIPKSAGKNIFKEFQSKVLEL